MKLLCITVITIFSALTVAVATAADQTSLTETGEALFHNPALGGSTNELSCSSCHSGGSGLESAADKPEFMLAIGQCLSVKLGGSTQGGQVKLGALAAYIRELSGNLSPSGNQPDLTRGFQPRSKKALR